ncbi:hypothetical protein GH789_12455 [Rhizobium pusense]|uniref:hypothetical protein n=1 Tax=Agrobacterium pusense TaxID=648995 RepID=UPI00129A492E|nr:hypothetical protein [Agrobacterium pusense]MRG66088.1 hypothetical protein [Agrobacterium pusense]
MQIKSNAFFCDDARQDEFGSFTIVGAYAGVINLVPTRRNRRIGNFVVIEDFPAGEHHLRFRVTFTADDSGEVITLVDQAQNIIGDPDAAMVLNPMGLPLRMEEDGILKLTMVVDENHEQELCSAQILYHEDEDEDEDEDGGAD